MTDEEFERLTEELRSAKELVKRLQAEWQAAFITKSMEDIKAKVSKESA